MDLKESLKQNEIQSLIKQSNKNTLGLIDLYKQWLKTNNQVFRGPIISITVDHDGPHVDYTAEFEDWVFNNSVLLKEEVTLILLIGELNVGPDTRKRATPGVRKRRGTASRGKKGPRSKSNKARNKDKNSGDAGV